MLRDLTTECQVITIQYVSNYFLVTSANCEIQLLASSRLSICPSFCMEQLGSHWTDVHKNLVFEYFSKIRPKNSSFIKIGQKYNY